MAEWTKIEDGMKQGGTAVEAALEAVNADAEAGGKKTAWANLTLKAPFKASDIAARVWRTGSQVHFIGGISSSNSTFLGALCSIPDGFKPTRDIHVDVPAESGDITDTVRLYIQSNNLSVVAQKGGMPFWLDALTYDTSDDFPDEG